MFSIKSDIVWFLICIHVCKCQRRIQDGIQTDANHPYVVYLVKAPTSKSGYDYWLCGGALVSSDFVVTSAACIKDVDYLYVIAGYKRYVTDSKIATDQCTSKMKKKVVYTCYPQGYELKYEQLDVWSLIDIGVAKVESPYDFNDPAFKELCSYTPEIIPVSYDAKYQEAGVDAVVFGWGHRLTWRKLKDKANYNEEFLNYAPVIIIDKTECKSQYEEYGKMRQVIDKYMICTSEGGNLNDLGGQLNVSEGKFPLLSGCGKQNTRSLALNSGEAIEDCQEDYEYDETRRGINISNHSRNNSMTEIGNKNNSNETRAVHKRITVPNRTGTASINRTASFEKPFNENVRDTRRYGICQNDHGGPLVTWVGAHATLIGVASVFKVTINYTCTGPYLYTSTQCNGAFLDCILTNTQFEMRRSSHAGNVYNSTRRSFCRKSEDDERHDTVERHISWLNHPDGAADDERNLRQGNHGPDVNERPRGMNEEKVNEREGSVNLPNKMDLPNKRYPLNEKFSVNVNNAPNERYAANNKHLPIQNNAPNINENGAPNNKYGANYQLASGVPMIANNKYTPYNIPASIGGPASNGGPALYNRPSLNNKPAQNNWPTLNYKSDQMNYHAPNTNPAQNHGTAKNNGPIQNNWPAPNNRPFPDNKYAN